MPKINKWYLIALAATILYAGGYFMGKGDKEVVVKERIKYVTKENVRERIIKKPDGTEIVERETRREESLDRENSKTSKPVIRKWRAAMHASRAADDLNEKYRLAITRRLLPNLYFGGYVTDQGYLGLALTFDF